MDLPEALISLLYQSSTCYIATTMPDGSPRLTQTWVDTDGEHILIDTVQGFQKVRNIELDPRVAVTVADPDNPRRYFAVRGRVIDITAEAGPSTSKSSPRSILAVPTHGPVVVGAGRCASFSP